ncbi:hypothetical protein COO60DRAFT_1510564, partial [Scenedesmus sp. NREL 46B-D3]
VQHKVTAARTFMHTYAPETQLPEACTRMAKNDMQTVAKLLQDAYKLTCCQEHACLWRMVHACNSSVWLRKTQVGSGKPAGASLMSAAHAQTNKRNATQQCLKSNSIRMHARMHHHRPEHTCKQLAPCSICCPSTEMKQAARQQAHTAAPYRVGSGATPSRSVAALPDMLAPPWPASSSSHHGGSPAAIATPPAAPARDSLVNCSSSMQQAAAHPSSQGNCQSSSS